MSESDWAQDERLGYGNGHWDGIELNPLDPRVSLLTPEAAEKAEGAARANGVGRGREGHGGPFRWLWIAVRAVRSESWVTDWTLADTENSVRRGCSRNGGTAIIHLHQHGENCEQNGGCRLVTGYEGWPPGWQTDREQEMVV